MGDLISVLAIGALAAIAHAYVVGCENLKASRP